MVSWWRSPTGINWRAAALLGLISSTFSTLVSQFTAARLGRDAIVDWMSVAAIPFRDGMIQIEPSGWIIAAGIAFHQWADFSWEVFFFGVLGWVIVEWIRDGKPTLDVNNPKPELRNRSTLGIVIIWKLKYEDGEYVDGYSMGRLRP